MSRKPGVSRAITMPDGTARYTCGHEGHEDTVQRFGEMTCPKLGPVCLLDGKGERSPWTMPRTGTTQDEACGCHIDGMGILQDPLRVHHCAMHTATSDLLAMLKRICEAKFGWAAIWPDEAEVRAIIARCRGA